VPLPFTLPSLSAGYAALGPAARKLGHEAAASAARALGELLEVEVRIEGRAVAGPAWPRTPAARLSLELTAVEALAALEVEPALVVRLVQVLAGGGDGEVPAASRLSPLEQASLELLTLLALDGACAVDAIAERLAPRLTRAPAPSGDGALGIELEVRAGRTRGRARLLLPAAALRALEDEPPLEECRLRLPASLRRGTAALLPQELEGLAPGDVLLVQGADAEAAALVLPGGYRAAGRLGPEGLTVEELSMPTRTPQIPVTLEVELCRLEVSLAELARLEPGAVLPLPVDRRGLVTLRAGERAVARGELVEVDGAIGVRISALEVDP
jgi:type III secretion protein Q